MTYNNGLWGISRMDQVLAHETGHVFWATDEYNGINEYSGYLNAKDTEGSGCLMDTCALSLSAGTKQQIGWKDTDGDSILDIIDTNPDTNLIPYTPDPTTSTTLVYTGFAQVVPYPNNNSAVLLTVLINVVPKLKVSCQEVFAPLVVVYKYSDIDDALQQVNDSDFGLQAGIFTNDARIIFKAYKALEVGGVIVGDVPTYRIDHMPYGGVKQSGLGREGVRYAIEEMTEPKLLVMNLK